MKFSVLQQDLLPILQAVSRSVGIHSTLPVLDNILLSAEAKKLKIAATNLEIGVIKYLSVDVEIEGDITVPARTLSDIISNLSQSKVEIETEGEILVVKSGKFKASINGIAATEFPAIPVSNQDSISFPKESLASVSQILFAAAVDEGRPVLTGILTDVKAGNLDFVSTDGFRLAHLKVEISKDTPDFKLLIPKKTYEEILKILQEEQVDSINIATSENQNQVVFKLGSSLVSSRLIEGIFPNWEKIIPQNFISRAVLDKQSLEKAIKLASVFAKSDTSVLVLNTQKGILSLKSQTKEIGSQENEVEGEVEGEEVTIAFNAKFLQDAISFCPSTQVIIEFSGPLSATQIKPVGVEGLQYIIMPVRLN